MTLVFGVVGGVLPGRGGFDLGGRLMSAAASWRAFSAARIVLLAVGRIS
jgi:hypothetical protein